MRKLDSDNHLGSTWQQICLYSCFDILRHGDAVGFQYNKCAYALATAATRYKNSKVRLGTAMTTFTPVN